MIVINKKTLNRLMSSIFIITFSLLVCTEQTLQTVSVPVSDKIIVIDAGHGGEDGGATSVTGISEADINLSIALKVQNLLEQSGTTVILTRSTDEAIYDTTDDGSIRQKKISDLKNRVKLGNESSADIFVSIHLNKIPQTQYDGWQTFYNKNNLEGKRLAESIQKNLNETIQKENNRIAKSIENIYIIDHIEIPTAIVECGFLSNQEELKNLQDETYQEKLAWGIYTGIMSWFEK